ncbi:MAG TPA: ABC transporter permease [Ktedonobacterales bacterium]|nr:ABC transporter permease [Ktedonobacterales bacterium]
MKQNSPRAFDNEKLIASPKEHPWWIRSRRSAGFNRMGFFGRVALALASLPLLLFLILPLVALVLRVPLHDPPAALADPAVGQAIQLSLMTTLITLGLTLLGGTPLALLLARGRIPGRAAVETLLDLPLVLPPAVAGIALLVAFGRFGLLGGVLSAFGVTIPFTTVAVIMAQVFVAGPLYIRTAIGAFTAIERDLEDAAAVDGAGPIRIFRFVTLPLAAVPLIGGAVMTWARALGEFGATIIFAGNLPGVSQTMPLAIYLGFEQDFGAALTLSLLLLFISFAVLFLVRGILRQRASDIAR